MLACVLTRSRIDGAKNAAAVIKLLVGQLRLAWPDAKIIVRGHSGFCRQRVARDHAPGVRRTRQQPALRVDQPRR